MLRGLLNNVIEAVDTRQKYSKRRSLQIVNEQFEKIFNAVATTQIVIQMSPGRQAVIFTYSLFFVFLLSACSSPFYSYSVYESESGEKLLTVPFFPQEKYHCGPAALASVLNFHHFEISPDELAEQIFIPDKKGSLQFEIKAATRRADFVPYELSGGLENLFQEIDAGHPVLVLQNLAFNWKPQWHYAVVVGYDPHKQQMILHSGTRENYRLAISTFMKTWERSGKWALVALPPEKIPHTAEMRSYMREASILESVGREDAAVKAYRQSLEKWPDNEIGLIGMGNFYYRQERYQQSVEAFLALTRTQKNNAAAWNNLAYALQKQGCFDLSLQAIGTAISHAGNSLAARQTFLESQQELQETYIKSSVSSYCAELQLTLESDFTIISNPYP